MFQQVPCTFHPFPSDLEAGLSRPVRALVTHGPGAHHAMVQVPVTPGPGTRHAWSRRSPQVQAIARGSASPWVECGLRCAPRAIASPPEGQVPTRHSRGIQGSPSCQVRAACELPGSRQASRAGGCTGVMPTAVARASSSDASESLPRLAPRMDWSWRRRRLFE